MENCICHNFKKLFLNHVAEFMWVCLWNLFVPWISVCFYLPLPHFFFTVVGPKSCNVIYSALFFIRIVLVIPVHLLFQINLRISLCLKNLSGILLEIALNLQSNVDWRLLTSSFLLFQFMTMVLSRSSLISFLSPLYFQHTYSLYILLGDILSILFVCL